MRKVFTGALTALMLFGLFALPAQAGWVEIDMDGNTSFFASGKIKETAPDDPMWTVFDLQSSTILIVDTERRIFAQGGIDEHCRATTAILESSIAQMSPEERALMEQLLKAGARKTGRPQVTIAAKGPGEKIAGYATQKYEVKVDGKIYEELWLAPGAEVMKELDPAAIRNLEKKMLACTENIVQMTGDQRLQQPEQDPVYQELMSKGWLMRSINYTDGTPFTEQTVATLEKKDIPASEFQPPKGYRKVPFSEFMFEE